MSKIVIIGGGTFSYVRNHLALAAPAFGTTAFKLRDICVNKGQENVHLYLTKMADTRSNLITNDDISSLVDDLLLDKSVSIIFFNVAMCDYNGQIENVKSGNHAERLHTSDGMQTITLTPSEKVIAKIRKVRPDIFLVGFKTTTNASIGDQFLSGLSMMKSVKCNLVLANDTVRRTNIIITAEETVYSTNINDRDKMLEELVDMTLSRANGTFNRTNFIEADSYSITDTPESFQTVIKFLIDNGGFLCNNNNNFTPGHFCYKLPGENKFYSSQRKADHNLVFTEGMSLVEVMDDNTFKVTGKRKASVGARSQWLILQENPEFDCIIHTHNPMLGDELPTTPQKPYQCGSLECGLNTVNNMGYFLDNQIKAVYLQKHGANILFSSKTDPNVVIDFVKKHIELGHKVI